MQDEVENSQNYDLLCLDGTVPIPDYLINENKVLKNMLDEGLDLDMTPLNFYVKDVTNYVNLCKMRHKELLVNDPLSDKINLGEHLFLSSLENVSVENKIEPICNILAISNFLDNEQVIDVCTKYCATFIEKFSTLDDIEKLRKMFNITNDLTDGELEKIRAINGWCNYSN